MSAPRQVGRFQKSGRLVLRGRRRAIAESVGHSQLERDLLRVFVSNFRHEKYTGFSKTVLERWLSPETRWFPPGTGSGELQKAGEVKAQKTREDEGGDIKLKMSDQEVVDLLTSLLEEADQKVVQASEKLERAFGELSGAK